MTVENINLNVRTNAGSVAAQFRSLSDSLRGLQSAASGAQSAGRSAAQSIRDVGDAAKKANGGLSTFIGSLKRIAMYRMLRTIIKEIAQAIKEGMDNLYEFSKANGDFGGIASAFDGLASSAQTLKNQLGATFGQMLAAAAPALEALLNLLTKLTQACYPLVQAIAAIEPVITAVANAVSWLIDQLISLFDLLGLNVGKIVAEDATAAWKDAKTAAGDYKKAILGFDEINRLNGPSGGGGGGGNGGGYEFSEKDMPEFKFDWVAVFMDNIKKATDKVKELAQALNKLPKSVAITVAIAVAAADAIGKWLENPSTSESWIWKFNAEPQISSEAAVEQYQNFIESLSPKTITVEASVAEAEGAIEIYKKFIESLTPNTVTVEAEVSAENAIKQYTTFVERLKKLTPTIVIEPQVNAEEAIAEYNRFREIFVSNSEEVESAVTKLEETVVEKMEQIRKAVSEKSESAKDDANQNFGDLFTHSSGKFEELKTTAEEKFEDTYQIISVKSKDSEDDSNDHFGGLSDTAKSNIIDLHDVVGDKMDDTKAAISTNTEEAKNTSDTNFGSIEQSATDAMSAVSMATYNALENFGSNVAIGLSTAASNFGKWVGSTVSAMANWAQGVVGNLKAAMDAFKSDNPVLSTLIFGTDIGVDTNYASAPLIPAWIPGGLTSAIPVFANGGSLANNGTLFLAGEAGAEIVADMGSKTGVMNVGQMENAVANGNLNVVNTLYAIANMLSKEIRDKDFDVELDGQSLADKMYHYNQQAANRYGSAMVSMA